MPRRTSAVRSGHSRQISSAVTVLPSSRSSSQRSSKSLTWSEMAMPAPLRAGQLAAQRLVQAQAGGLPAPLDRLGRNAQDFGRLRVPHALVPDEVEHVPLVLRQALGLL